jgi:hypothetical protein
MDSVLSLFQTVGERVQSTHRQHYARHLADIRALLIHPELFDVVAFHAMSDWSEISDMGRFLRQTMQDYGYEKPIWVGNVNYTASPSLFLGSACTAETTLHALASGQHPRHAEVEIWFRAEQSKALVKKTVLAMAEGLAGINIGNLDDWGIFAFVPTIAGTAAFRGMIETKGIPPKAEEPRPAYYALALLAQKLADFSVVKALELGKGVYAYQFTVRAKPVYVLWYDDSQRYLPGDAEPTTMVGLRLPSRRHALTDTPTVRGVAAPHSRTISPRQAVLQLEFGSTPLFLEPVER